MRWDYGMAQVEACAETGVAVWRASGLITPDVVAKLIVDALCWHEEVQAKVHLSDYREAVIEAPVSLFLAVASSIIRRPRAIARPMVIVPRPSQADFWHLYATAMRVNAIPRVVALDYDVAAIWAASHVLVPSRPSSPCAGSVRLGYLGPSALAPARKVGRARTRLSARDGLGLA
jgi:hypothetical protein